MNLSEYQPVWNQVEPLMRAKLEEFRQKFPAVPDLTLSEVYQTGDEEFRMTLDLKRNDTVVLGLDFVLADAETHGEDEPGFGIRLDVIGYGGLALGGYSPGNYTADAFTMDVEEVVRRVEALDTSELADFIVSDALKNPQLLKDLEKAG